MLFDVGDVEAASKEIESLSSKAFRDELNQGARALIEHRYTIEQSVKVSAEMVKRVLDQPVKKRKYVDISNSWPSHGRIERLFGHKLGHKIRQLFRKPAKVTCAGSEWPHTLGINSLSQKNFEQQLLEIPVFRKRDGERDG